MPSEGEAHDAMGMRGVSRPGAHDAGGPEAAMDRTRMLREHHERTLWVYWLLVVLGFWMLFSPLTLDYGRALVEPAGGRSVWLSLEARVQAMTLSDVVSGALLVGFGWRSLQPGRPVSLWACCFVGIWLSFAPVLLWAPSAAAYANSTIVGALVIALSILIPGMPNMIAYMRMGGDTPPGWSYNPSSWPQRWILIALGLAGWLVSRHLAAYQLGYVDAPWEPFFGDDSRRVLTSDVSQAWPVSDAALGALAYTFEFLMGFMGGTARWRTMPWMVAFFGILVIPLGLVHIALVISQPLMVGAWCTMCLLAALIMLPMIPLEVDEVVAMGQHLAASRRRGESLWRVFWKGGDPQDSTPDERSPPLVDLPRRPAHVVGASLWGVSAPWTLVVSTLVGVWVVAAPAVLGVTGAAADLHHLAGALVVVFSVIATGEVLRVARWLNAPLGLALIALVWWLPGASLPAQVAAVVAGIAVVALVPPRGPKRERYGSWDRFVA